MYSVPVRSNGHHGITEMRGILRFDGERLILQYQLADLVYGDFRNAPTELMLPPDKLVGAQYHAGMLWLSPSIELRVSDFHAVAALPAAEPGRLRLRLSRADRGDAKKIIMAINALCADVRFAQLNASINRLTSGSIDPPPSGSRDSAAGGARSQQSE